MLLNYFLKNSEVLFFRWGFPGGSDSKESACNVGDLGLIPGWEDPLEEGMATHSSILVWRISMDRGAWQATYSTWGCKKSVTTEQPSSAEHSTLYIKISEKSYLSVKQISELLYFLI